MLDAKLEPAAAKGMIRGAADPLNRCKRAKRKQNVK
jgi:hypothetical protein